MPFFTLNSLCSVALLFVRLGIQTHISLIIIPTLSISRSTQGSRIILPMVHLLAHPTPILHDIIPHTAHYPPPHIPTPRHIMALPPPISGSIRRIRPSRGALGRQIRESGG